MCNRSWFASRASFVVVLGLTFPLFAHAQAREHTLHAFGGNCWLGQQIFNLVSGLAADSKGNLYGARSCGSGEGDIFESSYDPHSGWRYAVIYTFPDDGSGGVSPQGALTVDNVGNLYGTTYFGGANGCGVVYELMPDSSGHWTETVLYSFGSLPQAVDGCGPTASVVFDQAGNLYGTATGGGANNYGVAFELSPTSTGAWSQTVLHSFGSWWGPDGSTPWQGLVLDQSGNLYGTTPTGGKYTYGTVFELSRESDGTWNETPIHEFTGGSDGAGPNSLVFDSRGNLYGPSGGPLGKSGGARSISFHPPRTEHGLRLCFTFFRSPAEPSFPPRASSRLTTEEFCMAL
jgi:uncharacterized repeat protein (TIGR03803 family)